MELHSVTRSEEKYPSLIGHGLLALGRDFGFNLPSLMVEDICFECSTHIAANTRGVKGKLFLQNDGISFMFESEAVKDVIGSCVESLMPVKDIIATEILPVQDVVNHLNDLVLGRARTRLSICCNQLNPLLRRDTSPDSARAVLELTLSHIYGTSDSSDEYLAVVMQYVCKCKRNSVDSQPISVRRNRFRRKRKEPVIPINHEYLCFLIPREQALNLHRYLLCWLRLREVNWREMVTRIVQKDSSDLSLSLEALTAYYQDANNANNGQHELDDRRPSVISVTSENYALSYAVTDDILPELKDILIPGDQEHSHPPPFVLSDENIRWMYDRARIPLDLQVFMEWFLVYSSDRHGYSLQTLYRRSAYFMQLKAFKCPCLLVVTDAQDDKFAALMSHLPHISSHTYGTICETRLFNLPSKAADRKTFRPSDKFDGLMIGNSEMLNIGIDSKGRFAITIFDGLTRGHLQACDAFKGMEEKNLVGTVDKWLDLQVVELWCFKAPHLF